MTTQTIKHLPAREEIPAEFKWDLTTIYDSIDAWETDFKTLKENLAEMIRLQPDFPENATNLLAVLRLKETIGRRLDKLFIFAKMHKDENNADPVFQALTNRIQSLAVEAGSVVSFIVPALVNFPKEKLDGYLAQNPDLALYRHFLAEIDRQREHVLSAAEEKILAEAAEIAEGASTIFGMLDNADLKFPAIRDENGQEVELTKARFATFLESKDRRVRKDAFTALYSTYAKFRNTFGATLDASVKSEVFYAKTRRYESALQASLESDNIPVTVYQRLIEVMHSYLPVLQRYLQLRKKLLNLPDLHMYDLYTPLIPEYQRSFEYEAAKEMVLAGLKPLGAEYQELLKQGFTKSWIDVYENQGKTSGAYSWGAFDSHPYVLLNYQGKIHDVFTIAHEMGHALHSYYSNKNQPYIYAGYRIFVAEVASTVNEALLMEYMLEHSNDPNERLYLINQYLEQFRTTVFRQTMFAEFEKIIHEEVENGGALTAEWFSKTYLELNQTYYGAETVIDPEIAMEWSRIPHFYSGFYVYKYATGYSAAIALSQQILKEGRPACERYLQFLKSGDSDYPLEILRRAGVDMESSRPIEDALEVFKALIEEMAELTGVKV
jgi:oligoendopeptidase F